MVRGTRNILYAFVCHERRRRAIKFPCQINMHLDKATNFSISIANDKGEEVLIGFDKNANQFFIDRTNSGKIDFEKGFAERHTALRLANTSTMNISLIIDVASVELFADDGLITMTDIFFPSKPYNQIHLQSIGKRTLINRLEFISLKSSLQQ